MGLGFLGRRKEQHQRLGGIDLGFRVLGRQKKEGLGLGGMGLGFYEDKGKKV
jgi:hypothetical protein